MVEFKEELVFSHLNEKQPNLGDEVIICDGQGSTMIATLQSVEDLDEDDGYEPEDGKTCYWFCESADERYDVSDYPFWAYIPEYECPEDEIPEVTVFEKPQEGEKTELDGYEIVGSEIRKK